MAETRYKKRGKGVSARPLPSHIRAAEKPGAHKHAPVIHELRSLVLGVCCVQGNVPGHGGLCQRGGDGGKHFFFLTFAVAALVFGWMGRIRVTVAGSWFLSLFQRSSAGRGACRFFVGGVGLHDNAA